MWRILLAFYIFLLVSGFVAGQDDPYTIARLRIEHARQQEAQTLILMDLHLTELPPEVAQLTHLRSLSLSRNDFTELPSEVLQLTNLEALYLSDNHLTELPPAIAQLTQLYILDLNSNELNALPATIGRLSNLHSLRLLDNNLTDLPIEMGRLTNLKEFWVHINPLTALPPMVVEQGEYAILAHLQGELARQEADKQRLFLTAVSGIGLLAALILGFRHKQRELQPKKKRNWQLAH
jgi:Leucine-rich repeat (LRR) protein